MAKVFRPRTGLTTFTSLEAITPAFVGELSQNSVYELQWTQIDLPGRSPPEDRCCGLCNPEQLAAFRPSSARDHRLRQFAAEFVNPIAEEEEDSDPRPASPSSAVSGETTDTVDFEPMAKGQSVPQAQKDILRARLVEWRILRHKKRGSSKFLSAEIGLPPRTLDTLVSSCGKFLSEPVVGKKQILAVVKHWDFGTEDDFRDVAEIICDWRSVCVSTTPKSQHRTQKRTRAGSTSVPLSQPIFTPPQQPLVTPARSRSSNDQNITPRRQINSSAFHPSLNSTATVPDDMFSSPATPRSRTPYCGPATIQAMPQSSVYYPHSLRGERPSPVPYTAPIQCAPPLPTPLPTPNATYYRPYIINQTPQPTLNQQQHSATPITTPNLLPTRPNYAQMWPMATPPHSMSPYLPPHTTGTL
ncbi:hypothetical protein C8R43DRAFT_1129976 [Mycena crocata]|nr:hypothetical protein C8R43DRAFT_1129976 [Mycena crocata]